MAIETATRNGKRKREQEAGSREYGRRKTEGIKTQSLFHAKTDHRQVRERLEGGGATAEGNIRASILAKCVRCCARHGVHYKPGRPFPRDRQEYRRKSRGLDNRRRGRRPKFKIASPLPPEPETRKDSRSNTYLLS